ncbi:hypothetical protein LBMAG42_21540 [Deltaproteobacteria bacterium]|nr:hypothetical protein LBMAG42_21540 [Deltaproteobacteria bacterium]
MTRFLTLVLLLFLGGCARPTHLTADFGRAYSAFDLQAQRDRPAAATSAYRLGGTEGLAVRKNVLDTTSDPVELAPTPIGE